MAAPGRKRNVNKQPLKVDGVWRCVDCLAQTLSDDLIGRTQPPMRCDTCSLARYRYQDEQRKAAHKAVGNAVRQGRLPRPGAYRCVDCGNRQAEVYDHRDYSKPLQVAPVCRSCNVMRGPASEPDPSVYLATALRRDPPSFVGRT